MLNWSDPNSNPMQDLKDASKRAADLITTAANEAVNFAQFMEDPHTFYATWLKRDKAVIAEKYPDFNLSTEAQEFMMDVSV